MKTLILALLIACLEVISITATLVYLNTNGNVFHAVAVDNLRHDLFRTN